MFVDAMSRRQSLLIIMVYNTTQYVYSSSLQGIPTRVCFKKIFKNTTVKAEIDLTPVSEYVYLHAFQSCTGKS